MEKAFFESSRRQFVMLRDASNESSGGLSEFAFISTDSGVIGWIRRDLPEDLFADFIRDPNRFFNDPSSRVLKDGPKTRVIKRTFGSHEGATRDVIIKRFHYSSLWRRLGYFFFPSPALRSLKGALVLGKEGIHTPLPLAAFEFRSWKSLWSSYYLAEEIKASQSLRTFCRDILPTLSKEENFRKNRQVLKELASLLARLHSSGIYHPDLKGSNILIRGWDEGRLQFFLVDVVGVEKNRRLSRKKRVKNLMQLNRTLGKLLGVSDQVLFLNFYSDFSLRTSLKGPNSQCPDR